MTPCLLQYLERRPDGGNAYKVRFLSSSGFVDRVVQLSARKLDDSGNDSPTINFDIDSTQLDARQCKLVLQAVSDFDKAGHVMMFEHGPVVAEPPCHLPEAMRPMELSLLDDDKGNHSARVSIQVGHEIKTYDFKISTEPAVGLRWERQFFLDMGGSTVLAGPLLESIWAIFEASHLDLCARK